MHFKASLVTESYNCIFYVVLICVMYVRLHETFDLETLRNQSHLEELVSRYATNRGCKTGLRASKIFRTSSRSSALNKVVDPFRTYFPTYFFTRKPQRINYCAIPKNMSTVMTAIICMLYSDEFRKSNRTLTGDHQRSCHENNAVHSLKQVKKLTAGEKWVNFAMVREPEERFLSGFLFMCTPNNTVSSKCEGCINDIECALKTTIDHARRFAAGELSATSFLLWHLGPQNWHCHFQKDKRMQVFKYSPTEKKKTLKDITTILEDGGVNPSTINYVISSISNSSTKHETFRSSAREFFKKQLRTRKMQRLLVKLLYWDYIMFDYPLPSI
ncbi:hypothetical protein Q1695_007908 [Nippostrongylus brasiliensis]|nr:hypothetical protein Q1695_007908 [Nippostrongylus brasiliensis]